MHYIFDNWEIRAKISEMLKHRHFWVMKFYKWRHRYFWVNRNFKCAGCVLHTYNPCTQELRQWAWATQKVQGQPEVQCEAVPTNPSILLLPCQIHWGRIGMQNLDISVETWCWWLICALLSPHSPSSHGYWDQDMKVTSRGGSWDRSQRMDVAWAFGFVMSSVYLEYWVEAPS